MQLDAWAFAVSCVSGGVGLTTLSLVIRNELRERRRREPILWAFHRFGKRTKSEDGEVVEELEVAELVQFGRQPTRIMHYFPVGFTMRMEEGFRLRSHIRAEDTLPLLLDDLHPDDAWLLISHFPRDDRRWLLFEWVPLEPTSEAFQDREMASLDRIHAAESSLRRRLSRWACRAVPARSIVRPVGPGGYRWARIRADKGVGKATEDAIATITSLTVGVGFRAY